MFSRERLALCFTVGEPFGVAPQRCSLSFLHCKDTKKIRKRLILFCSIYVKKHVLFCSTLILFCSLRSGLILSCSNNDALKIWHGNKNIMKGGRGVCASRWGADSPPKRHYFPFIDSSSSAYSAFASKQGHGLLEKSRWPKTGQWYFSTSEESRA